MAWFDILGGVAGGLNQGLSQLQQAQQAKQLEERQQAQLRLQQAQEERIRQLQQAQEERAAAAEVRAAALNRYNALQYGVEMDPSIDPDMIRTVGAGAFIKGPQGGIMKKMTPSEQKAEQEAKEYLATAPDRALDREISTVAARQRQQLLENVERNYGPDWITRVDSMAPAMRRAIGKLLLASDDVFLRPEETATGYAAGVNAAAMAPLRTIQGGNMLTDNDLQRAVAAMKLWQEYSQTPKGMLDVKKLGEEPARQKFFSTLPGALAASGAGAAGTRPDPGGLRR